jgi:hypothetical protein
MTTHGHKDCAIDHFVKFGGGDAMHHNCIVPKECISVDITSCVLVNVHLLYPEYDHDPPHYIVKSAVGYIILWPWKVTTKF